jgi:hypothetical protein
MALPREKRGQADRSFVAGWTAAPSGQLTGRPAGCMSGWVPAPWQGGWLPVGWRAVQVKSLGPAAEGRTRRGCAQMGTASLRAGRGLCVDALQQRCVGLPCRCLLPRGIPSTAARR